MKKRNAMKVIGSVAGASVLLAGAAPAEVAANIDVPGGVLQAGDAVAYDKIAEVKGEFSFTQDVMSPASEIFNLFGTAATGLCAKPGFAFDTPAEENYYVNVGGRIEKEVSVSLAELKRQGGYTRTMVCTCATSSAMAQSSITGARVADLLKLAGVADDANTISFISADGYRSSLPLQYVLEKDALLVYDVAGEGNPAGLQIWMPSTVAKYFTRQITEIELTAENEAPVVEQAHADQRAKVSILNRAEETFHVGDQITFEGYADDCGVAVTAIEFSLDGENWTSCAVENANADKWVCWNFAYTVQQVGTFKLDVRARTADGTVSPLAASVVFKAM